MYILTQNLFFPPVEQADKTGILAIGGDLSVPRLILAYKSGIFPWFNNLFFGGLLVREWWYFLRITK